MRIAVHVILLLLASSCTRAPEQQGTQVMSQADLVRRGMVVYNQACIACHSANPNKPSVGPALAGSSLEVLEARVVYQKYPDGYKPKGAGNIAAMPAFPHLKKDIPALHAYLQSVLP